MMKIIGVIGGHSVDDKIRVIAYKVGYEIAKRGFVLVTGGLGGVMEAASMGAKDAGGLVIGILPGIDKYDANDYVDIPIVTGINEMRNVIIVRTADVLIAIDGGTGTLTEIAFAKHLGKKVFGVKCDLEIGIENFEDPIEAVNKAIESIC
uniref:TIGR00725 family protein n=1 Tax=candidate division WOR-3 bacterium TaxID=2052148 RepID=A0A7C4UFR8_UNCW3